MMTWLRKLFATKSVAVSEGARSVRSLEVVTSKPPIDLKALAQVGLGAHHWCMTPEGVGIVVACADGLVTANLCKPNGANRMLLNDKDQAVEAQYEGALSNVRRAYIEEIPNRHNNCEDVTKHLNQTQFELRMKAMGYEKQSEV